MRSILGFGTRIQSEQQKAPSPLKVSYTEPNINEILTKQLYHIFSAVPAEQEIILVCVGTDRSTGDSLGPLVGTALNKLVETDGVFLFGTLDHPVHAVNLRDTIHAIEHKHPNPFIVAIDACLGQLSSVGIIQIGDGPVKPGAGVNKDLPSIGNMHVTGIVNVGGFMEYFVLQNTRLSIVMKMAEVIANAIYLALINSRKATVTPFLKLD